MLHHGHTASEENLQPLGSKLEKQHRLISMESRGVGRSQHTREGYSLNSHADDVVNLMDYLKINSFNYIGHSMGGGLGFQLAINYPKINHIPKNNRKYGRIPVFSEKKRLILNIFNLFE